MVHPVSDSRRSGVPATNPREGGGAVPDRRGPALPTTTPWLVVQPERRVVGGRGALDRLGPELERLGAERALVVGTPEVAAAPVFGRVVAGCAGRAAGTYDRCAGNAPVERVAELAAEVRARGCDALVAVGGGSVHDTVKGAALLVGEGGELEDYVVDRSRGRPQVPELAGPRLPMLFVPTTFAGAEATVSAGFARVGVRSKAVVVDRAPARRVAVLDPVACATTPRRVLAATYANALNHCVESLCSLGRSPLTDALALHAASLLGSGIGACLAGDEAATARCQAGAFLSATAMPADGLGICHAVGHVLGTYGVAHGDASAAILAHGMRYNQPACAAEHAAFLGALGIDEAPGGDGIAAFRDHLAGLGLPTRLGELALDRSDLASVAHEAFLDRHVQANPRPFASELHLERFLESAW